MLDELFRQIIKAFTDRIGIAFYVVMALFPVIMLYLKLRNIWPPLTLLFFECFLFAAILPGEFLTVSYVLGVMAVAGLLFKVMVR
jgi:hypothetical protein